MDVPYCSAVTDRSQKPKKGFDQQNKPASTLNFDKFFRGKQSKPNAPYHNPEMPYVATHLLLTHKANFSIPSTQQRKFL